MRESIIKPAVRKVLLCWLAVLCTILVYMVASMGPSRAEQSEQPSQQGVEQSDVPIALPGKPVAPDHSKLSEHNIFWLKTQPAQEQMEFLFGAAINHDQGATDLIAKYS